MLIAFHKPYGVLSQFRPADGRRALAEFGFPRACTRSAASTPTPKDSCCSPTSPRSTSACSIPATPTRASTWVQVERVPTREALRDLERGVPIQGRRTRPAHVRLLDPAPPVPDRVPPIRARKSVPACWIALELVEGRNRQVRRMTAAIGHPTLRLLRVRIGAFDLDDLAPGEWRTLSPAERARVLGQ